MSLRSQPTTPAATVSTAARLRRLGVRTAIGLAATLTLGALGGAMYQAIGDAKDRRAVHAPGKLVAVGGTRLHLDCRGTGSPTVVLEAGATGFAATWGWVQPRVARETRVCAYDRAGMGWSGDAVSTRTATSVAQELHDALTAAGEQGPFVLAGHSLGGIFAQVYATQYPGEVAGLVLVDPSHPDQTSRFKPGTVAEWRQFVRMIGATPTLARLGVLRATGALAKSADGLPADAFRQATIFASSPRHLATSHAELAAWFPIMADARAALAKASEGGVAPLGDRPVTVLSATVWPNDQHGALPINQAMHAETARLSTRGRHVLVAGADHMSLLMREAHATRTAEAILGVVQETRTEGTGGQLAVNLSK